jgi:NodT family efflux transporter outer membrane factor (OMF) lipoprotein
MSKVAARLRALRPRPLALSAATLLLASCALGPDYHRPTAPVPVAFKETPTDKTPPDAPLWKPSDPQDGLTRGAWWVIFNDAELDALETQVNISNQTVKEYQAEYAQAVAQVKEAEAPLFPTVSVSVGAQRGGGGGGTAAVSSAVGSGAGGSTHTEFTLEPSVSWTPDIWGVIRRTIESRKANMQFSAAELANAQLSAQATLAADYFDLRATDSLRELLAHSVQLDERALEITRNQFNGGMVDNLALASAQAALQAARAQLVGVEQTRGTYEHAIAMLTGHLPSEVSIPVRSLAVTVPEVPVTVPSSLLERNPGIAAAERQMREENALIGVAEGAYFPTITLTALGGYAGNPLSSLLKLGNRIWSLGANASDSLFQGGAQVAAVALARQNYNQYVAAYRQTVLTTFQSVEDQLLALRVLQQQTLLQAQAVQSAQKAADIALNQYTAGTISYTTVITDIQALIGDQEALLTLRQNELIAVVTLIEDLGGGWDTSRLPG